MKKYWRHTGHVLTGLGILHTVVFVIFGAETIAGIFTAGFFNSIGDNAMRGLTWYGGVWLGVTMILFGFFAQSFIKSTAQPLPRYVGWTLAALGLVGAALHPLSGAILVLLLGLSVVFVRPKENNN
jgi:predicted benzoate:H+ symporter BenE